MAAASVSLTALAMLSFYLAPYPRDPMQPSEVSLLFLTALVAFPIVGALVVSSRPANPIGWIFCTAGLLLSIGVFADEYGRYGRHVVSLPGLDVAAWLSGWTMLPAFGLAAIFLPLLFPDGRLISRRWRPAAWLGAAVVALLVFNDAFRPAVMTAVFGDTRGPAADSGAAQLVRGAELAGALAGVAAFLISTAALVIRLRAARGVERQQLKWFVYVAVPMISGLAIALIFQELLVDRALSRTGWLIFIAGLTCLPISVGVAILRYRLYDIDVLINRTLVYGALLALLAATYFGAVVVLSALLRPFAGASELAVAGSTLAVVVLFAPLRSRIQRLVDERFYRSKYDAARTLDAFAARLRDQVDLDALEREVLGVVGETLQPAHAALWLRKARR